MDQDLYDAAMCVIDAVEERLKEARLASTPASVRADNAMEQAFVSYERLLCTKATVGALMIDQGASAGASADPTEVTDSIKLAKIRKPKKDHPWRARGRNWRP
jgi:hypothetical protein